MLRCLFRTMHGSLKSHSSIIKQNVKFANFCHDQQWPSIFHYSLVTVSVAGCSITERRNKRRKKACCVSLLPSQSHKYIKLKMLFIVHLSHQWQRCYECHWISGSHMSLHHCSNWQSKWQWNKRKHEQLKERKRIRGLSEKKKWKIWMIFLPLTITCFFPLKKKKIKIIGHTHFMPLRQLSFYFLWN